MAQQVIVPGLEDNGQDYPFSEILNKRPPNHDQIMDAIKIKYKHCRFARILTPVQLKEKDPSLFDAFVGLAKEKETARTLRANQSQQWHRTFYPNSEVFAKEFEAVSAEIQNTTEAKKVAGCKIYVQMLQFGKFLGCSYGSVCNRLSIWAARYQLDSVLGVIYGRRYTVNGTEWRWVALGEQDIQIKYSRLTLNKVKKLLYIFLDIS